MVNKLKFLLIWNIHQKGTNLLAYGAAIVLLNSIIFNFEPKNNEIGILIHHLGFR